MGMGNPMMPMQMPFQVIPPGGQNPMMGMFPMMQNMQAMQNMQNMQNMQK